ncbi:SRPBCC domain-containing protein [Staphylococcus xylosus]|uniref:SRPBCC domain-containing protein n=1 Tax=Staphylococcus xylosus TaxID=1288 RepID=UPI003F57A090
MEAVYAKDVQGAYQTLKITIEKDSETVFNLLSTTEGVQKWFPQLSFEERIVGGKMTFHMDEQDDVEMEITAFEDNIAIGYTWSTGAVRFDLYDSGSETVLILDEFLPFDFPHIILDFSGWQFQMQSIKSVAETGRSLDQNEYDFDSVKDEVETKLDLG